MFEYLKPYKHILVSGMQRSGTTICMRMIQYDLEAPYCYWVGNRIHYFDCMLKQHDEGSGNSEDNAVYHSPGISSFLHKYGSRDDTMIIWVRRDPEEIIKSAQRINWNPKIHLRRYQSFSVGNLERNLRSLIDLKEKNWKVQKSNIKHWVELEYESLKTHPLWFDKKNRLEFEGSHQTSPQGDPEVSNTIGDLKELLQEFPK